MSETTPHFSAEFFKGNRERLRTLFSGTAPIVITANGLLQSTADSTFPFRQDRNFWYLTGIDEPDVVLVMEKDSEYLIVPKKRKALAMFDGQLTAEAVYEKSHIKDVFDETEGWKKLNKRLAKVKHVATLAAPPEYIESHRFYTNPARANLLARIKAANDKLTILDLREQFVRMRVVKQPAELAAILRAIKITSAALTKVSKRLRKFVTEAEIEAMLTYEYRVRGASGHAFPPIVAAGEHTPQLHYMNNDSPINGNLVLIDTGAEVDHYAADISRTYSVHKMKRREKAIFNAVLDVQNYAFSLLKPGVVLGEYEHQVHLYMGEKLRELGLIKSIEPEFVHSFFPSYTSHFLGLDVHDIGNLDQVLEPGMVLTVEPGIYVEAEGIGVRIEDIVLVTPKGIKILTRSLPREL